MDIILVVFFWFWENELEKLFFSKTIVPSRCSVPDWLSKMLSETFLYIGLINKWDSMKYPPKIEYTNIDSNSIFITLWGDFGYFSSNLGSSPSPQKKISSPTLFLKINKNDFCYHPLNIDDPNDLFYRNDNYLNMNTCAKLQGISVSVYLSHLP